jgi:uncharacterized small protein (DUF1192 family)
MTEAEIASMGQAIVAGVREALRKRDERIAALEQKITRLEAIIENKNFAYLGVWKDGKVYGVGAFVTHDGSIWHSNQWHNRERPGNGAAGWTLACKAGRDAR